MSQYRVSPAARLDLEEIWLYIATDDPQAADRFTSTLVSHFAKLASTPEMGRLRKDLLPEVRSFSVGRHIIFYRAMDGGVEIVRVLHGARDLPPLFE